MMHIFFSLPHTQALRAAFSAKDICVQRQRHSPCQ
jgi:hypothetical protein